jgi:hypothetical protein
MYFKNFIATGAMVASLALSIQHRILDFLPWRKWNYPPYSRSFGWQPQSTRSFCSRWWRYCCLGSDSHAAHRTTCTRISKRSFHQWRLLLGLWPRSCRGHAGVDISTQDLKN